MNSKAGNLQGSTEPQQNIKIDIKYLNKNIEYPNKSKKSK